MQISQKMTKDTELYRKTSDTDLDQYHFYPLMFWVFSNHHPSAVFEIGCISDLKA